MPLLFQKPTEAEGSFLVGSGVAQESIFAQAGCRRQFRFDDGFGGFVPTSAECGPRPDCRIQCRRSSAMSLAVV